MYNTSTTNPIFTRHAGDQRSAVLSLTSHRTTSWWRWDLWRQMNFSLRDDKVVNRIENRSNGVEKLHLSSVSLLESDTVCVCESCVCLRKWRDEMLVKGNRLAHGCFPPTTSHYFHLRQTNALSTLASFRNLIMKCHKHTNKQTNKQTNARPRQPVHRYHNPATPHTSHKHTAGCSVWSSSRLYSIFQVFSLWVAVKERLPGRCPSPILHCAGLLVERSRLSDAIKMFFH